MDLYSHGSCKALGQTWETIESVLHEEHPHVPGDVKLVACRQSGGVSLRISVTHLADHRCHLFFKNGAFFKEPSFLKCESTNSKHWQTQGPHLIRSLRTSFRRFRSSYNIIVFIGCRSSCALCFTHLLDGSQEPVLILLGRTLLLKKNL